ncbi:MAG: hypothetical protein AABW50_03090 [Nanoarchaeota archaeon]
MEEEFKCEICNRNFNSRESLEQHNLAKHSESTKKEKKPINTKKIRKWAIFIIVFAGIFLLIYWSISGAVNENEYCANQIAAEMNIGSHQNLKNHIHQDLEIIIDGIQQAIPSNVGIAPGIMRPIHTHDSTGEIHVEGPCVRDFTLGEFFNIWNKEFDATKIFDKTTENGTLNLYVNGQESTEFRNLVLREGSEISIKYTSNK